MRYQHAWDDAAPEDIPAANQDNLERTIRRALELGINHIETARGYGTSEMQLGRILPRLPRAEMLVQTKVSPRESQQEFLEAFDKSMAYLKLDYVDFLSIHGINNAELLDQTLRKGGCLEAARKIQADGRARFIGFSTHAPREVILTAIATDEFDYVNLHWYFVNEWNWNAIQAARARDMGVFIISPNDKGGLLYKPPAKLKKLCEPLSPLMFGDLFCLARPEVHTLSLGASKPEDFDEHLKALAFYDDIPAALDPVEKRLRDEMISILGADWCGAWWRGLPDYADCPGGINVSEILRLWMHAKSLDMIEYGKMRYNLLGNAGHWFPGGNASEFNAKEIEKAVADNPFAARIPGILAEAHELLKGETQKRLSET